MTKKMLFALGLSGVLFLFAGQALAAANSQPAAVQPAGSAATLQLSQLSSGQQLQAYMTQMGQGSLSAQNQMALYKMLQGMTPVSGNVAYYGTSANRALMLPQSAGSGVLGYSTGQAWLSLMSIITTILVWVVLLLLIAVLWHWLKKHKHS
jgi:hypothetical protein